MKCLQEASVHIWTALRKCVAVCCSVLQCAVGVVVCRIASQCVHMWMALCKCVAVGCSVLQSAAVSRCVYAYGMHFVSVLLCVAACCIVCCRVLQCVAVCCSVLQHVAMCVAVR